MPLFLLMCSLGYEHKGIVSRLTAAFPLDKNASNLSTTSCNSIRPFVVTRNKETLLMVSFGSCFAILYLVLSKTNDSSRDGDLEIISDNDLNVLDNRVGNGVVGKLVLSRVCFWGFVCILNFICLCVFFGSRNDKDRDAADGVDANYYVFEDSIQVYCILRTFCLWVMCLTNPTLKKRRWFFALGISLFVYIQLMVIYHKLTAFNPGVFYDRFLNNPYLKYWTFHIVLDIILIIGHRGDEDTTPMTILNCRLFYITCMLAFMQIMAFSAGSSS